MDFLQICIAKSRRSEDLPSQPVQHPTIQIKHGITPPPTPSPIFEPRDHVPQPAFTRPLAKQKAPETSTTGAPNAQDFTRQEMEIIWTGVYKETVAYYADVIPTPAPIASDLYNFRLICKASKKASEALFQKPVFTTRRISYLDANVKRLEQLVKNEDLVNTVTTV